MNPICPSCNGDGTDDMDNSMCCPLCDGKGTVLADVAATIQVNGALLAQVRATGYRGPVMSERFDPRSTIQFWQDDLLIGTAEHPPQLGPDTIVRLSFSHQTNSPERSVLPQLQSSAAPGMGSTAQPRPAKELTIHAKVLESGQESGSTAQSRPDSA